jgi:thioredoxin-related protein
MIRLIKSIVILSSLLSFIFAEDLALGSSIPLPDAKMIDISGKKVSLNDVKMKNGLLVNFSCNTCPWVHAWQDRYNGLAKASAENNIGFITINPNSRNREKIGEGLKDMQKFSNKYDHDFLYTVDEGSKLATAFGATQTPQIFLFDSNGKLVYRGVIDDNAYKPRKVKKPYLLDAISALGSGKPISIAETKGRGCSIKFPKK